MTSYIYLFTRRDLSIPQQIIQTAHAVDELNKWAPSSEETNSMVLFDVPSESELLSIAAYLEGHGIKHSLFYEPDIEAHTSIACAPISCEVLRKKFKRFSMKR